jgi:hypothetical protein
MHSEHIKTENTKKYYIVGKVPKSNKNIAENTGKTDTANTYMYDRLLSWIVTCNSIELGELK